MNRQEGRDDDQIARLLYDVGVMVEMSYTPGASGAGTSFVKRLSQYFGYDKGIVVSLQKYQLLEKKCHFPFFQKGEVFLPSVRYDCCRLNSSCL